MNTEGTIQARAGNRTVQEHRAQLAQYLAQQPTSKQVFHKWMQVLEVAGLALVASAFAIAMYVSINHTVVPGTMIAAAWFAFPVSLLPLMILVGLHTIVLRADVPIIILPGKSRQVVTGTKAVWPRLWNIMLALAAGVFWGTFAWAVWSADMGLIMVYACILGTAVGIAIPVAIVASAFQKLLKFFR